MEARQRSTPGYLVAAGIPTSRQFIVEYNLLFYFIEIIRNPLLGQIPPLDHYLTVLGVTVAGYALAFFVYRRMRGQLAFCV